MSGFTHFDAQGNAIMVDVTDKDITERCATASGCIRVSREIFDAVKDGTAKKGDVLGTARIAGIMAAKRTWGPGAAKISPTTEISTSRRPSGS